MSVLPVVSILGSRNHILQRPKGRATPLTKRAFNKMPTSKTDFTSIPIIDLSLAQNASTLPVLLDELRHALTEVGFLYVSNHGVPDTTINTLVQSLPRLFALPDAAKEAVALENSPHFLGYSAAGTESTAGRSDHREQFEFATELKANTDEGAPLYERLRGPNQVCIDRPYLRDIDTKQ